MNVSIWMVWQHFTMLQSKRAFFIRPKLNYCDLASKLNAKLPFSPYLILVYSHV